MTASSPHAQFSWDRLIRLRQVLNLIAGLRDLQTPPTSADGLRQALSLLGELGQLVGVDPAWIDRVRGVLDDERTFNLVLAIVQYIAGMLEHDASSMVVESTAEPPTFEAASLAEWLPLVLQLLSLLRSIRGAQ